jgi:hypothetical protein
VGPLVAEVAALGLAIAFTSPVSVVTVIVLLSMPQGRRRAFAFVGGWLLAIAGIGALAIFALHGQDFSTRQSTPSRAASSLEILLGCLLLIGGAIGYRRRRPSAGPASEPKWLSRVERTHWMLAVLVGAFMLSYALSLAAASEILKAHVDRLDESIALAVFAVASIVTIAAPLVVALVAPERSEQRLAALKAWLLGNSRTVVLVVLMVVGALLIVRGAHDLIA